MTFLDDLPLDWRVARFSEVASTTRRPGRLGRQDGQLVPFIPMALIPEDKLKISRWELRKPEDIRSGVVFSNGDLLLAKITPCLENGKQGVVREVPGGWGIATTEVFPIRTSVELDADFLAYYLKMPVVRSDLARKMEGSTGRQRLPKSVVESLVIPLPSRCEQRAITHVLRTVQRAKEATEKTIAATRALKKSLMRHLFTYGPVPVEEADRVELMETQIGQIPEHWEVRPLGEVIQSSAFGPRFSGALYDPWGNIAILRTTDIDDTGRIDYSTMPRARLDEDKFRNHLLRPGDFLVTRSGTCGIASVFGGYPAPVLPGAFLIRLRLGQVVEPVFLREYFNSQAGRSRVMGLAYGAVQKNISGTALRVFLIPVPPTEEQRQIIEAMSAADCKIEAEGNRKRALDALFQTVLHNLMTGKLRVQNLTAAEPAGDD